VTAAGQDSGAAASQAFTDANINTVILVDSSATTSTYGDSVIFGATVTPLTGSNPPTGTVGFFEGTTLLGIDSVGSPNIFDPGAWFYSVTLSGLTAGTHAIHAFFLGGIDLVTGDSFNDSISETITHTVSKANATIILTGYSGVYDGVAHQATGTAVGVLGESLSGLDLSGTTHTNIGTYLDVVTFTHVTGNYKNTVKNVSSRIL
jgi:Bacterial Ig-like domain (group 3)